jgi:arylsulfatase A-like enzyme
MKSLAELKIEDNTLVLFSSDNGGAVGLGQHGGSNGPLREGKSTTWEGGVREPFIARWKGRIAPNQTSHEVASTLDILPTAARVAGASLPANAILDGADLTPLLLDAKPLRPRDHFYYHSGRLRAMRRGPWKLHLTGAAEPWRAELYQVETDISERFNVAAAHPERVEEMRQAMERHSASFQPAPSQR